MLQALSLALAMCQYLVSSSALLGLSRRAFPIAASSWELACALAKGRQSARRLPLPCGPPRRALIERAFRLEYATVVWMVIEAAVTIWAAFEAAGVSLLAFGMDSLIELASAGVLLWRLTVEPHHGFV